MNNKIKIAISFFALCQTMILLIDKLQGTSMYNHLLKNLCNKLIKLLEKEIDQFYTVLNKDSEQYFHKTTEMVETMVDVIENKDLDIFINLLKDYRNGEIMILPDNKHQKIASQLERV